MVSHTAEADGGRQTFAGQRLSGLWQLLLSGRALSPNGGKRREAMRGNGGRLVLASVFGQVVRATSPSAAAAKVDAASARAEATALPVACGADC
mmetsp:Transcript_46521/g.144127  ORF Transcript_46521/g.144127 Transcript_46521/m.144127 type:complete len:94 (-) Transcript_46521:96-377(-)